MFNISSDKTASNQHCSPEDPGPKYLFYKLGLEVGGEKLNVRTVILPDWTLKKWGLSFISYCAEVGMTVFLSFERYLGVNEWIMDLLLFMYIVSCRYEI